MPERAPDGAKPSQPKSGPSKQGLAEDYAALEATLRGRPLGRWFLAEFARRNRSPEIQMLLDAIAKLEAAVFKPQRHVAVTSVLAELGDMSEAIARTRREIASLKPPHRFDKQLTDASGELDQIVEATEATTSEILSAAEDVQEIAWTLREKGVAVEFCDRLDHRAIDIYTACSFQDITGQRTDKVVRALRFIEQRVNAMIEIWGVDDIASWIGGISAEMERLAQEETGLPGGPQTKGEGLKQDDVDQMMGSTPQAEPPEAERFERPEPLTLDKLHGVKRSALFG
jgi:chemotaxis protein CheZ